MKYHKIVDGVIELEIITRKEYLSGVHPCESFLTDKHQFRGIARYSNGHMEWQWCDSFDNAVSWCNRFCGV
jgi:hypothetical protein